MVLAFISVIYVLNKKKRNGNLEIARYQKNFEIMIATENLLNHMGSGFLSFYFF